MSEEINIPEHDEDFIYSARGTPFKSALLARTSIDKRGLDPSKFEPKDLGNNEGFVIARKPPPPKEEKYYRVTFLERQNEHEERDVTLGVNGEFLVIKRGVETIIPERYKECADHTTREVFTQKPNQPRKTVGHVKLFPYSVIGMATKEEYEKLKAEGTRTTREVLEANKKLLDA